MSWPPTRPGFANVVASLGTALTAGQVELANRYADAVALAYDVDLAGETATQRGLLEELGPVVSKVRVIRIPAGKDPDELIRTDPDQWRQAVADAAELLPYFMQRAAGEVDLRQAQGRSGYTRRMLDLLRRLPDKVEQDSYVPQLAQLAGIDERILRDELARGGRPIPIRPAVDGPAPTDGEMRLSRLEREALTLLLLSPSLAASWSRGSGCRSATSRHRRSATRGARPSRPIPRPTLSSSSAGLDAATADLARSMLASVRARGARPDASTDREELRVCLVRLRIARINEQLADLEALIRAASDDGATDGVGDLERTVHQLHEARRQLEEEMNAPALAGERRS